MRIILNFAMLYSTLPKREIMEFFSSRRDSSFTLEEVSSALPEVGKSTVYRIVSKLVEEGSLMKDGMHGRSATYQYADKELCPRHMHVRCSVCGCTQHLDEETTRCIESLVSRKVGFEALNSTVLDGVCKKCRKKEIV